MPSESPEAPSAIRPTFGFKLLSVEFEGWPPTGPDAVALDFKDRRTVLIGRNGSGKSAILEALHLGFDDAIRGPRNGPRRFKALLEDTEGRRVQYEHSWEPGGLSNEVLQKSEGSSASQKWQQRCWFVGSEAAPLWTDVDGKASIGAADIPVPTDGSVPSEVRLRKRTDDKRTSDVQFEITWFYYFCSFIRRVHAGVPHANEPRFSAESRSESVFLHKEKAASEDEAQPEWTVLGKPPARFRRMIRELFGWSQSGDSRFGEFIQLGQTIGAFKSFEATPVDLPDGASIAQILVDGANVGVAPDGTLRLIETIYGLLSISDHSLLLLEEPETGIHPGALVALLNVLDSYTFDRQVIMSSHSPVVLSSVSADELRIVTREDGKTRVRTLTNSELNRAAAFLRSEGTLDDFWLSGALDDS